MARYLLWPVSKVELSRDDQIELDTEREAFLEKAHEAHVPVYPRPFWRLPWPWRPR